MNEIVDFYKKWLGFNDYYGLILGNIRSSDQEFNQNGRFLRGIDIPPVYGHVPFSTMDNDRRIDVPVWFGDLGCRFRVMVFGLEPRDTNSLFNVERVGRNVYAAPFGVDRWNDRASVKRKPQNLYYKVFRDLSERDDVFLLFSDVVKRYEVVDARNPSRVNDSRARRDFSSNAEQTLDRLTEEIRLVQPTHIAALGRDSFDALRGILQGRADIVHSIRHPANGGAVKAYRGINDLLLTSDAR